MKRLMLVLSVVLVLVFSGCGSDGQIGLLDTKDSIRGLED